MFTGFNQAATAEIAIVSRMVRVPPLQLLTKGAMLQRPLRIKLAMTAQST